MPERRWYGTSLEGAEYEPYPQKEIVSGEMNSRAAWLRDENGENLGAVAISFFRAEPSVSRTTFNHDETIYIVEGTGEVLIDDEILKLEPGVAAHFFKGADAELHVFESMIMFVVESS
jgi:uncharacterized cupin superfamily protein